MKSPDQPASAAPSAQQTAIDIAVEKIVYGGEGLARTTEGVLLVPGVIPGERAAVRREPARKGVRRGELVELLAPSSDRVQPGCPYFGRCGGCQHQQIAYPRQLEIKSGVLRECCERIGKFDPGEIGVIASEPWAYRNRVRLRVVKEAGGLAVGYLEGASHQLCAIDQCPISSPALQRAIQGMNAGEIAALFPAGVAELELFVSDNNRELLATIYSEQEPPASFGERWMELWREGSGPPLVSVCWSRRRLSRAGRVQDRLWGAGALTYHAGEFHYRVSHHSFFQPNRFLVRQMMEAATRGLCGRRALDLFAGAGFFTVPLARSFEEVVAVEAQGEAAADLEANAAVAGTRIRISNQTVENFLLKESQQRFDAVVVDPPRAGLSGPARAALPGLRAPRIIYVSCDPTTLARDAAALLAAGYAVESIELVDQFPQTFHIETIMRLKLRD